MQIKHTFLFTLALGLVWTGYLFAYVLGPDPAMNGIFGANQTCATSGCHTGNAVNAAGGSLTITGLPATWTPSQTYPLSITIARTGSKLFGFQLSAVSDATNQQAGTLTAGNARVQIICGRGTPAQSETQVPCSTAGAIQYAEHNNAQVQTSTYLVNWTAPASASVGTVRFNLAGNAANGDISNQGDFIYTRVDKVDPGSAPPPPPPPDLTTRAFTIVDRGGVSVVTDGVGGLGVGYARIQPNSGNTTPAGAAIFGLRLGGVVVTEAAVPPLPLLQSGRIHAEVNAPLLDTGLAIANPNNQTANISFTYTNTAGQPAGSGTTTILANGQVAAFLSQAPFNAPSGFTGTFNFSSDVPISVVALRGILNVRGEFLITTLPVVDLATPAITGENIIFPHFAEGGGWSTQIVLINPTNTALTGNVQFLTSDGAPATLNVDGQTNTSFAYTVAAGSSRRLQSSGTGQLQSGSIRIVPSGGTATPSGVVIFTFKSNGITVAEAGVPALRTGSAFRLYAEASGNSAAFQIGSIQTGLAISNPSGTPATATLELTALDGSSTGMTGSINIPGNGQVARFLNQVQGFASLGNPATPFKGILRISSSAPLAVVGLRGRTNERGDFLITTTAPVNEASTPASTELLFPHLANGGGYTTQFILFSGTAGQASSGNLKFFSTTGTGLSLPVN